MSRLTEYRPSKNSNFPYKLKDEGVNTELDCIHKLGKIEDLMEKYEINSIEQLEEIIKDYDDMAKDVVEIAIGRKVDIKQ